MKFLSKRADSEIFISGLKYIKGNYNNNKNLLSKLIAEQYNFCSYTEKYFSSLESIDVEHFDSSLKYNDDYYNYYAVLHFVNNSIKPDEKYKRATSIFFTSMFYQNKTELNSRIAYDDYQYFEIDPADNDAREFLDFIGINHPLVYYERKKHIERLKTSFAAVGYTNSQIRNYFFKNKDQLSFISALESELGVYLTSCY